MNDRHDVVPAMEATKVESGMRLWWFGGPSYAIRTPQSTIYIDPYHGDERADDPQGFSRAIPNVYFPEDVSHADLILSTHDHLDHCDPATLGPLCARTTARIAAAPSSAKMMADWDYTVGRVDLLPPGSSKQYGDVTLTAYPARDWSDPGAVTFVLSAHGRSVFIGGDSLYLESLKEIGAQEHIDLAVMALGRNHREVIDQQLYIEPWEFAQAAKDLKARRVFPIHWEIWKGWTEDPQSIAPHLEGSGIELVILGQGESLAI